MYIEIVTPLRFGTFEKLGGGYNSGTGDFPDTEGNAFFGAAGRKICGKSSVLLHISLNKSIELEFIIVKIFRLRRAIFACGGLVDFNNTV